MKLIDRSGYETYGFEHKGIVKYDFFPFYMWVYGKNIKLCVDSSLGEYFKVTV